jgi:hypothetical protein
VLRHHGAFREIRIGCYGSGLDDGVFLDVFDLGVGQKEDSADV